MVVIVLLNREISSLLNKIQWGCSVAGVICTSSGGECRGRRRCTGDRGGLLFATKVYE